MAGVGIQSRMILVVNGIGEAMAHIMNDGQVPAIRRVWGIERAAVRVA